MRPTGLAAGSRLPRLHRLHPAVGPLDASTRRSRASTLVLVSGPSWPNHARAPVDLPFTHATGVGEFQNFSNLPHRRSFRRACDPARAGPPAKPQKNGVGSLFATK